jgi:hypothetical protein
MDDELKWAVRRWHEADENGRDDDADVACRRVLTTAFAEPRVPADFAARTAAAVARVRAADAAGARRVRTATVAGGLGLAGAGVYAGGPWALSMLASVIAGAIDLFVALAVRVATGMETGGDIWTLVAGLGRAAAALVTNPSVTFAILVMQGVAMAALVALHRLLGPERESVK